MVNSQKDQALTRKIEELEKQAAGERQEAATRLEKLRHQYEVKAFEDRKLQNLELKISSVNYSYLQHQYKSLLERHTLLDVKNVTFDEYISAEADKIAQKQVKAIQEETDNKMESLQSKIKELLAESASTKENKASLRNVISANLEEMEKLESRVITLTMETKKSSAKIQVLETVTDALDKALKESTQSLSVKSKEPSEIESHYNMEKKRLEDELCAFTKSNEILSQKLKKDKEGKETKLTEEEERVRSSVQPRNNTQGGGISSAVFTAINCAESICKYIVKAGPCCYRSYGLDINRYNVLAVVDDEHSVYLYSEVNKKEERLCTCPYVVRCLAWNQQGTLLAIGGEHTDNANNTIQVWDIPNRKISKRLKIKDNFKDCFCLDWKGDTITAGTFNSIYHWNINDQDNDQDTQGNKALLPRDTAQNEHSHYIATVQWSYCKSKLATITLNGDLSIYDEEFKLIHHSKAHDNYSWPLLQWCPWDHQVIATCCWREGYLKIWRVEQDITLIKEVEHEAAITNIKWIPSKKAIITAHGNKKLDLWEYPSLRIIQTMKGHTWVPRCLALNADMSAMVSKSDKEMIFWKPFDEF